MSLHYIPILEIFLGFLGFGLSILFCTTFCRACSRIREQQIEAEALRRSEQDGLPHSIYFIPFPGNMSRQNSEDHFRVPRYSQEVQTPPRYSIGGYSGPPPSYNESAFKFEDLPPAYAEHSIYPPPPPPPPPPLPPRGFTWNRGNHNF